MNRIRIRRARPAPPHHNRKSSCPSRKVRFKSFGEAVAAALRVSRHAGPLRVYDCPDCPGWHLTRLRDWKDPNR